MSLITINRTYVVSEDPTDLPPGVRKPMLRRRRVAVVGTVCAIAALCVGSAAALGTPSSESTTNVNFVALATPKKVANPVSIAAGKTYSVVIAGGSTTVPSDATTVQIAVSAKGAGGGTLSFYPTGDVAGGSGQTLIYPAAGTTTTNRNIEENVGQSDELTVLNTSSKAATFYMTLLGYSTQVTDGDISAADGTSGQVLTNTGSGAAWQAPGPAGEVYTSSVVQNGVPVTYSFVQVASVTVPAGTYHVTFTFDALHNGSTDLVECALESPDENGDLAYADTAYDYGNIYYGSATTQAVINTTSGGVISAICDDLDDDGQATVTYGQLDADQVGGAQGNAVVNATRTAAKTGRPELQGELKH